jgi:hypothetical protein
MLIVGRDRAHVRALLPHHPGCEIISASAFFDKIRIVAFLADKNLRYDDYAPVLVAHKILCETKIYPVHYANQCAQIYNSFFHGTLPPKEILKRLGEQEHSFSPVLTITAQLQDELEHHNLATKVSALYRAWRIIEEKNIVPPTLIQNTHISLRYLIDLTSLEIEIIKTLSHLGIRFDIYFPLDFSKRNFNIAIDYAAKQFELDDKNLSINLSFDSISNNSLVNNIINILLLDNNYTTTHQDICEIYQAPTLLEEADHIAERVAQRKSQNPAATIALAVRSFDQRTEIYKRALNTHNLRVKERKGQRWPLSSAGSLLQTIFDARLANYPKSLVISLAAHPLFSLYLKDNGERANLCNMLEILGIDDRFISTCRYEDALLRYQKIYNSEQALNFDNYISNIKNIINNLKSQDTLLGFLSSTEQIITTNFINTNNQNNVIIHEINKLKISSAYNQDLVLDLRDFSSLFMKLVNNITIINSNTPDYDVELLLLPELLGRHFDHVFIADVSFGRMPQSPEVQNLLNDDQRNALNKALGMPALRVFVDDPFEPLPVPPRQALEPFWFAAALASACKSIHISYAALDLAGTEQAPSEFFIWLQKHVNIIAKPAENYKFSSAQQARFLEAKKSLKDNYKIVLKQREAAFSTQHAESFAFGVDAAQLIKRFDGRLDLNPTRALTPTMIEAFAACAFYGFLSRIVALNYNQENDDIDPRIIGHIAHQTLERYFSQENINICNLKNILDNTCESYIKNNYISSLEIFWCYIDWLYQALEKLIPKLNKKPCAQEKPFGLGQNSPNALRIKALNRDYLLGGVIDRVDKIDNNIIITDYKLSSLANLRALITPASLLKTSFQAPLYLRLATHEWSRHNYQNSSFLFASIRDGELLAPLTAARSTELFERIFDDHHPQSLSESIDAIFSPVISGHVVAQPGSHCKTCDFAYICRHVEGTEHGTAPTELYDE